MIVKIVIVLKLDRILLSMVVAAEEIASPGTIRSIHINENSISSVDRVHVWLCFPAVGSRISALNDRLCEHDQRPLEI